MKQISDIKELNKICRAILISQSALDGEFVRNALSIHGSNIDKDLSDNQIFASIGINNSLILFELQTRESNNNVSFDENTKIIYDKAYRLKVIVYGDSAETLSNKIIGRFRSEAVREEIYSKGIFLEKVSNSTTMNEFINNTMWLRSDFSIDICCEMQIDKITNDYDIDSTNYHIINEEE